MEQYDQCLTNISRLCEGILGNPLSVFPNHEAENACFECRGEQQKCFPIAKPLQGIASSVRRALIAADLAKRNTSLDARSIAQFKAVATTLIRKLEHAVHSYSGPVAPSLPITEIEQKVTALISRPTHNNDDSPEHKAATCGLVASFARSLIESARATALSDGMGGSVDIPMLSDEDVQAIMFPADVEASQSMSGQRLETSAVSERHEISSLGSEPSPVTAYGDKDSSRATATPKRAACNQLTLELQPIESDSPTEVRIKKRKLEEANRVERQETLKERAGTYIEGVWYCQCDPPNNEAQLMQVKKASKNRGRWFYTCPSWQEDEKRCKMFLWAEDAFAKEREVAAAAGREQGSQ